jgi:hypothetical protein
MSWCLFVQVFTDHADQENGSNVSEYDGKQGTS